MSIRNEERVLIETIEALTEELRQMKNKVTLPQGQPLYTNKDLLALLQINQSTLKRYREQGYIGYSKAGDKYFYTGDDVTEFLKSTHIEPFVNNCW